MESFAIIIGLSIIVLLAWGIRLIRIDLEKSEIEIDKLNNVNNELSKESLYYERMYKEMLEINHKLVNK